MPIKRIIDSNGMQCKKTINDYQTTPVNMHLYWRIPWVKELCEKYWGHIIRRAKETAIEV